MNLLIRADASISMGIGHVMRCLALAQAWHDAGGRALFAMAKNTPAICARLEAEHCEIRKLSQAAGTSEDAAEVIAIARQQSADWVVVDGYQFDADYQTALKAAGLKILFVDDNGHARHYSADLVLNQNASAREDLYASRSADTRLLLGTRYCLLRREFLPWSGRERPISDTVRTLLVMMGGSDPTNVTRRILEAVEFAGLPEMETTVVVGGSNPNFETLEKLALRCSVPINFHRDVQSVVDLMARADLAISAAGSTSWELCFMGVPSLLLDVADNQTPVARELHRLRCAVHVGNQSFLTETLVAELQGIVNSSELRRSLSRSSRQLVDGRGAKRVARMIRGAQELTLRPARADDRRLLWEWANEPAVRTASFSTQEIPWESHCLWFSKKLGDKGCILFLAENDRGSPCGQIRFDIRDDGDWDVDVSIAKESRGRGLASSLIRLGVEVLRKEHRNVRVHAFVKQSNTPSVQAFQSANFRRVGSEEIRDNTAIHLVSEPEPYANP